MGLFFILRLEIAFILGLKTGAFGIIQGKGYHGDGREEKLNMKF